MKTLAALFLALTVLPRIALAVDPPPAPPDKAALLSYANAAEHELRDNILPFWLKNARNPANGGFHSFIGQDLKARDSIPRGALLTSRMLWTFSAVYRKYHDPEYLEMARYAFRDQMDHFRDKENGGLFWSITPDGQPADAHKQIYGQVFGLYGLAEYYMATGDATALAEAKAIYALIEKYAHDPKYGGYYDSLNREWQRETGPQANLLGEAPKSQNSHIHILEGFTNLLRVWPDPGLRQRQRELIELTLTHIIDPKTHHLVLFMKDDWTPIGDHVSYGHDIELSWLLVEAADVLGDPALVARAKTEALAIAKVTSEGIDSDGGVYMEGDPKAPTNLNKEWWEQAEAATGYLNAYQIAGDPRDYAYSRRSWDYIQKYFVDRQRGDWYEMLRRDDTPILEFAGRTGRTFSTAKLSVWKCPYHNSRCCLQLIERLHALAGDGT